MNQILFEAILNDHKRLVHHINENAWKYQKSDSTNKNPFITLTNYISTKFAASQSNTCCAPCC
jgi:hypothetical protein